MSSAATIPAYESAQSFLVRANSISESELDALPYGAMLLDPGGFVLRCNTFEAKLAGSTKERILGQNFFKQIAPSARAPKFYGRFREGVAAGELQCTFRFCIFFEDSPRDVSVTLSYNRCAKTTWVLMHPLEGTTEEIWGRR